MSVCKLLLMSASSLTFLEGVTKHSRKTIQIWHWCQCTCHCTCLHTRQTLSVGAARQAQACHMHDSRLLQTFGVNCALCLGKQLVQPALAEVHHIIFDMLVLTRPCVCLSDVPAGSAVTSQPGSTGTVTFVNGKCTVSVSPCLTVLMFLQHCQLVPLLTKLCRSYLSALLSACASADKSILSMSFCTTVSMCHC